MNPRPAGRSRSGRWRAVGMAALLAAAFTIAGLVLGMRHLDGGRDGVSLPHPRP